MFAFAYRGAHAESLRHRKEWFVEPAWPTYAAWWIDDDHIPTWEEAMERVNALYHRGPTPFAFTFKQPYDADGRPMRVDRSLA